MISLKNIENCLENEGLKSFWASVVAAVGRLTRALPGLLELLYETSGVAPCWPSDSVESRLLSRRFSVAIARQT